MTENKRFEIIKSKLIKDGWVINDKNKQFTFPTLKGDKRALISYCKALNELHGQNHKLKQELFETSKELLWATSDEVDRALHYEDEVEELRKEIFE